ncbi:DUF397 domain-containing protein [Streptomyces collinus]|uniref:DUF397 domain-containing protein n=1 Tax=Streptomyces collinus TaxID=42684 RepID=UPI003667CCCC
MPIPSGAWPLGRLGSRSSNGRPRRRLAVTPGTVHVRDSKNVEGPRLAVTPGAWADFLPYLATN